MEYEILPHTADLRIRARGKTREELFLNALRGMSAVLQPLDAVRGRPAAVSRGGGDVRREVKLSSPDSASLLIDFLSEALALSQINREVYTDVTFDELAEKSLRGTLIGLPVSGLEKDIKAVTYHGVEIRETDAGYEATVIYDI